MQIDRAAAKAIGADVLEALQAVAEKHGLEVEVRGGSFDPGSFRPKVEFKTAEADAAEFARYAHYYGLTEDDFEREFVSGGRTFKITGINPKAPRYPIQAQEVATGKMYKFSERSVQADLVR